MGNYQGFRTAERIEQVCAQIYRALANRFRALPAEAALFERLEAEEIQHALRVRSLFSQYRASSQEFRDVRLDQKALGRMLTDAEGFLARILGADVIDLATAHRTMVDLEEQLGATHAQVIAQNANPSIRRFFALLAEQDRAHNALLATHTARA